MRVPSRYPAVVAFALWCAATGETPAGEPVSTETFAVRATVEDHCAFSTSRLQLDGICRYDSPSARHLVDPERPGEAIDCGPGEDCPAAGAPGQFHHPRLSTGQLYIVIF